MARPNDRVFFALAAGVGALLMLGSILPTFEVGLDAAVGAGDDQRAFNFNRTLRAITYAEVGSLVYPVAGAILGLAGLAGLRQPRSWLILLVAAVMSVLFVHAIRTHDHFRWEDVGVYSCGHPRLEDCIGFLAPAVRELRADILRRPIAREQEFHGPERGDYRTRGRVGWTLTGWTIAIFSFVAWFRAVLVFTSRVWIPLVVVVAIGLVVLAYFVLQIFESLEG